MKLPSGCWTTAAAAGIKLKAKLNHNPFYLRQSDHYNRLCDMRFDFDANFLHDFFK